MRAPYARTRPFLPGRIPISGNDESLLSDLVKAAAQQRSTIAAAARKVQITVASSYLGYAVDVADASAQGLQRAQHEVGQQRLL